LIKFDARLLPTYGFCIRTQSFNPYLYCLSMSAVDTTDNCMTCTVSDTNPQLGTLAQTFCTSASRCYRSWT